MGALSLWLKTSLSVCLQLAGNSPEEKQASLVRALMEQPELRQTLAESLALAATQNASQNQNANACKSILESFISSELKKHTEASAQKSRSVSLERGRELLLSIALAARIEGAEDLLQKELESHRNANLLFQFKHANPERYHIFLRKFINAEAENIRKQALSDTQQNFRYELSQPLIFEAFLQSLTETPPQALDLKNAMLLYAVLESKVQSLFKKQLVDIAQKNLTLWLEVLRKQDAWMKLRLVPLLAFIKHPDVVSELLALSQDKHPLLRALAETTLDTLTQNKEGKQ